MSQPGNILLTGNYDVRVADFGLSRHMTRTATSVTGFGTVIYASPESLKQELVGKPTDVWSYGVIVWEVATETMPFKDKGIGAVVLGVAQGTLSLADDKYLPNTPPVFVEIVSLALRHEEKKRPAFADICDMLRD